MMISRLVFLLVLVFLNLHYLQGQDIGLSAGYRFLNASHWNAIVRDYNAQDSSRNQPFLHHSATLGVNVGFSLSNHLRLIPELTYARLRSRDKALGFEIRQRYLGAALHLNIYPFGFGTQLHCPTFSRTPYGRQAKSGIFLQVSAGASLLMARNYQNGTLLGLPSGEDYAPNLWIFYGGLGGGYDLVFWERLVVAPTLNLFVSPSAEVPDYDEAIASRNVLNLRDSNLLLMPSVSVRVAYLLGTGGF